MLVLVLAAALGAVWSGSVLSAPWREPAAPVRYADGAPPGFSGGFGEQSCHSCHFSAEPNTAPGRVSIAGVPDAYAAGETHALTITLERPGLRLGGFQLTARFGNGGAQAGSFSAPPAESDRVKIEESGGVQYAGQRTAGAAPVAAGAARWTVNWTAPASGGVVLFHAAANAADGDESASGDFVYTAVREAPPAAPAASTRSRR
jgi:hypothetical protein